MRSRIGLQLSGGRRSDQRAKREPGDDEEREEGGQRETSSTGTQRTIRKLTCAVRDRLPAASRAETRALNTPDLRRRLPILPRNRRPLWPGTPVCVNAPTFLWRRRGRRRRSALAMAGPGARIGEGPAGDRDELPVVARWMEGQLEDPEGVVLRDLAGSQPGSQPGEERAARADDELPHPTRRRPLAVRVERREALVVVAVSRED